jgi:hypothetical protein
MCIQDYRLARQTWQRYVNESISANVNTPLVPGASGRLSVVVSAYVVWTDDTDAGILIGPRFNGAIVPLVVLSKYCRSAVLSLEEHGPAVLKDLWVYANLASDPTIGIIDNQLVDSAENAVLKVGG